MYQSLGASNPVPTMLFVYLVIVMGWFSIAFGLSRFNEL